MNHCEPIKLSAFMDGELTDETKEQIHDHLSRCRRCAKTVAAYQQVYRQLDDLPIHPLKPLFLSRVKTRMQQHSRSFLRPHWSALQKALAPAAICAGIFLGTFLGIQIKSFMPTLSSNEPADVGGYIYADFMDTIPSGSLTATVISVDVVSE
jgi:anti-sigma factor RsiW